MSEAIVIHNRDSTLGPWELENDDDVYIGRQNRFQRRKRSLWANPYKLGKDGNRPEIMALYRDYIKSRIKEDPETFDLSKLKGKRLVCWCTPELCHGDVLVELMTKD